MGGPARQNGAHPVNAVCTYTFQLSPFSSVRFSSGLLTSAAGAAPGNDAHIHAAAAAFIAESATDVHTTYTYIHT